MGHEIRIAGLSYAGQEHNYPFAIIPTKDTNDAYAIVHNLCSLPQTTPDVIIVALDIPLQIMFHDRFKGFGKPYIAITPLENGPLCLSWSAPMFNMDWIFFISELGKQEAMKAGLTKVDHIQVGIDTNFWRVPTPEEKANFRKGMGITDDEFVILTVADNQERKNLWAAMATTCMLAYKIEYKELIQVCMGQQKISEFERSEKKVRHILVTRVDSQFGYKLRDMAVVLGINQELMTMNRGMPLENLWSLYAMSDCFLLTSKAEGLGMPVLEAMASGLPVVGTDTGAITELLRDGRGFLISAEYTFTDVWGNSKRDMVSIFSATKMIDTMLIQRSGIGNGIVADTIVANARKYAESRTWDVAAKQLDEKVRELCTTAQTMS